MSNKSKFQQEVITQGAFFVENIGQRGTISTVELSISDGLPLHVLVRYRVRSTISRKVLNESFFLRTS